MLLFRGVKLPRTALQHVQQHPNTAAERQALCPGCVALLATLVFPNWRP
jgi:hypothetical protein